MSVQKMHGYSGKVVGFITMPIKNMEIDLCTSLQVLGVYKINCEWFIAEN